MLYLIHRIYVNILTFLFLTAPWDAKKFVEPTIPFTFDAVPNFDEWFKSVGNPVTNVWNKRQIRFRAAPELGSGVRCSYKMEVTSEFWVDWDTRNDERPPLKGLPKDPLKMCYFSAAPAVLKLGKKPKKVEQEEKALIESHMAARAAVSAVPLSADPLPPTSTASKSKNPRSTQVPRKASTRSTRKRTAEESEMDPAELSARDTLEECQRTVASARTPDPTDLYGADEPESYNDDSALDDFLEADGRLRSWDKDGDKTTCFAGFMSKLDAATIPGSDFIHPSDPMGRLISERGYNSIRAFVQKILYPKQIKVSTILISLHLLIIVSSRVLSAKAQQ